MARRVFAIVCVLCFVLSFAQAETSTIITDKATFEELFNDACLDLGTSHAILNSNLQFSPGEVNDVYEVEYKSDNSFLQYGCSHGTQDMVNVLACYMPSGNSSEGKAYNYIMLIFEILCGTGIAEDIDEASDILEKLGFYDHLEDGDGNKITINGLSVSYMISSKIGIWFVVETE